MLANGPFEAQPHAGSLPDLGRRPGARNPSVGSPEAWTSTNRSVVATTMVNSRMAMRLRKWDHDVAQVGDSREGSTESGAHRCHPTPPIAIPPGAFNLSGHEKTPGAEGPRARNCGAATAHHSRGPQSERLLPSGLYRRPRSFTGSCARAPMCACGLYRRSGLDRHSSTISPNPEGFIACQSTGAGISPSRASSPAERPGTRAIGRGRHP